MKLSTFFTFLSLAAMFIAACLPRSEAVPQTGSADPLLDYTAFVEELRGLGHTVEETGQIDAGLFNQQARTLRLNGQDLQVYQFSSAAAQQAAAATISANGYTVGTNNFFWISQPYFFARDRLIVLYLGVDEQMIELLASELGRPITGMEGGELRSND